MSKLPSQKPTGMHAPWCPAAGVVESHAVCMLTVAEIQLPGQVAIVGLHKTRATTPIVTAVFRQGAADHLVAMGTASARALADALWTAVDMLG